MELKFQYLCMLSLMLTVFPKNSIAHQDWAMSNRFMGFRYEILGMQLQGMTKIIQAKADQLACFGWIQESKTKTLVGEIRCNKKMGEVMKMYMANVDQHFHPSRIDDVVVRDYPSSKILLHFSHFKILHKDRESEYCNRSIG